jgi:hypothetical protein
VDLKGNWNNYLLRPEAPIDGSEWEGKILRSVNAILDAGYAKGPQFYEWLLSKSKDEAKEILSAAGERGDKIHQYVSKVLDVAGIQGAPSIFDRELYVINRETQQADKLSQDEWYAVLSWVRFWIAHEPILYANEVPFYNEKLGYAGTGDAIIQITKACEVKMCKCNTLVNKIGLWDWKSGGGIYGSYSAQVAGYKNAENIKNYLPPKAKIDYTGLLRIGTAHKTTGGYEMEIHTTKEELKSGWDRFLAAKAIAEYEVNPFSLDSIKELQDGFSVKVNRYVPGTKKIVKKINKTKKCKNITLEQNKKELKKSTI